MNFYAISLPILIVLHLIEGVALVWLLVLRYKLGREDNAPLRDAMSRLYRYAVDGVLPAPPRTTRRRWLMAEALFSLTRHLSLLSVDERRQLGHRCSLIYHLLKDAEHSDGVAQSEALQLLSVIPLDDKSVERLARTVPAEPMGQLYRMLILIVCSPERVTEIIDSDGLHLSGYLVPRLVARLEECRVVLPVRSLLATGALLPSLVALRVVARYELGDYWEEVFEALQSPHREVRMAAIKTLAVLGVTIDRRVVEATAAMSVTERREVLRIFLREGYSAMALQPLSDAEASIGSPLAEYAACRTLSRKRTLVKTL